MVRGSWPISGHPRPRSLIHGPRTRMSTDESRASNQRWSTWLLALGDGFLGELDRILDLIEGYQGELKLLLDLIEGFLEELKLILVGQKGLLCPAACSHYRRRACTRYQKAHYPA
jgi:hypothetical protein